MKTRKITKFEQNVKNTLMQQFAKYSWNFTFQLSTELLIFNAVLFNARAKIDCKIETSKKIKKP